jgi:hypothetical protein
MEANELRICDEKKTERMRSRELAFTHEIEQYPSPGRVIKEILNLSPLCNFIKELILIFHLI